MSYKSATQRGGPPSQLFDKKRDGCGCWDEDVQGRAFSLTDAVPMPERSDFTDDCKAIRHYCEKHWKERHGQKG